MIIASVADFRALAKRRLPKFVFDYMDGGAGSEAGIRRNETAFDEIQLKPRMLINVEKRDLSTTLFGKKWSLPFGTAPIGLGNAMMQAQAGLDPARMLAFLVWIGIVGWTLNALMLAAQKRIFGPILSGEAQP